MRRKWRESSLGDLCELYQPKTISRKDLKENGQFPVFGANGIIGRYDQYNHEEPQILITCRGATCGSVNKSLPKSWITGNAMVIRPRTPEVDLGYLEYFCKGAIDYTKVITGAAQPQITRKSLAPVQIRFPVVQEQKRIVAVLDEAFAGIDAAIANTEKNLANARELFEGYRDSVYRQKGEGWAEAKLSEICSIKHGFAFKSSFFTKDGHYIVLTPGSFWEGGGFRDQGAKTKYYEGDIPAGYTLKQHDFLFAMTEQAVGLLGSTLIVPEADRYLHNQRLGLVEVFDGVEWHNDFFFHQFNTAQFRSAVQATASGVKVRHTSPKKLGGIAVSYPAEKAEQAIVAGRLNALLCERRKLESIYRQKLIALAELKQSLLQKAFTGELTAENMENEAREAVI